MKSDKKCKQSLEPRQERSLARLIAREASGQIETGARRSKRVPPPRGSIDPVF